MKNAIHLNQRRNKMKKLAILSLLAVTVMVVASDAQAAIRYVNGYSRSNGTYVSGHYRDTSNDGYAYNNANYLGYNN